MSKHIIALLAAVTAFIVFLPALGNDFINWDDNVYVYENTFVRSFNVDLFRAAFLEFHSSNWHPLTWLSHAIDYSLWGLNPLGHHLTNVILHALNTMLVVLLAVRLLEGMRISSSCNSPSEQLLSDRERIVAGAATGVLFGIHPLRVESVAWIAERKDLLCAFFFLLSMMSYATYVMRNVGARQSVIPSGVAESATTGWGHRYCDRHYLLALGFFVFSLLSKPMAVSLPFVLLILDWYPFGRVKSAKTLGYVFSEKLPFIVLSLLSAAVTLKAQQAGGAVAPENLLPLSTKLVVAASSLTSYLWKMIVPLDLVPYYPYPKVVSLLLLKDLFPVLFVIGITIISAVVVKKKIWLALWGYYVITLFPVLGIVQVGGQAMADRYTYLPGMAPSLLAGLAIAWIYERIVSGRRWRLLASLAGSIAAFSVVLLLSFLTARHILIWENGVVFWKYVIEKEPGRISVAHNNLGVALRKKGQTDEAIDQYRIAAMLKPDDPEPHCNLGHAYLDKGQMDAAIQEYEMALRIRPDQPEIRNNLGVAYGVQGRLDMAIQQHQAAVRLRPDFAEAYFNLGLIFLKTGDVAGARRAFESGLRIRPSDRRARQILQVIISKNPD